MKKYQFFLFYCFFLIIICIFAPVYVTKNYRMAKKVKDINRIKVVLTEQKRTGKWLAEQLGKDPATVSKWCTNNAQPGLETLTKIASILDVNIKDLLNSTKSSSENVIIIQKN